KSAPQRASLEVMQRALESAGVEFTNGGQPGVRPTPLWMLYQVTDRAQMKEMVEMLGRGDGWPGESGGPWKIEKTPDGIECRNQDGEMFGYVWAGCDGDHAPQLMPDIGKLMFPNRVTPSDLQNWVQK